VWWARSNDEVRSGSYLVSLDVLVVVAAGRVVDLRVVVRKEGTESTTLVCLCQIVVDGVTKNFPTSQC
jgi:hypothetical protein